MSKKEKETWGPVYEIRTFMHVYGHVCGQGQSQDLWLGGCGKDEQVISQSK